MAPHLRGERQALKSLKWYESLHTRKGRAAAGAFLIEGYRAVAQIARTAPRAVEEILLEEGREAGEFGALPCRRLSAAQIGRIAGTKSPQGIVAVVKTPAEMAGPRLPDNPGRRVLLLEDIQDPGNVGALIRTAAALGYDGVLTSAKCADPLGPKAAQASAGSLLAVWLRRTERYLDAVRELRRRGYRVIATGAGGVSCRSRLPGPPLVLALGNEGSGLSGSLLEIADHAVSVPQMTERVESLNVAAAGAICMFMTSDVGLMPWR